LCFNRPKIGLTFYIGKGLIVNSRHLDHFKENESRTLNKHKFYKIRFLQNQGYVVPVIVLLDNILDEHEAYNKETEFVKFYGRKTSTKTEYYLIYALTTDPLIIKAENNL